MAFGTGIPFALVCTGVDGEVLGIVLQGRRCPGILGVAGGAVSGELSGSMPRVRGIVVILAVASEAGVGGIAVVPIVASRTIISDSGMSAIEGIVLVVDIKASGHPVGLRRMAFGTVCRQPERLVVRVDGSGIVLCVAPVAGVRGVVVIAVVAGHAVVFNGLVGSGQRVVGVVVERGRCPCTFGVTASTVGRELGGLVVRIRGLVIIIDMAAGASIGRIVVIAVVASCTIVGDSGMSAIEGIVAVVAIKSSGAPSGLGSMAGCTVAGQAEGVVVRVGRSIELGGMATGTICGGACVAAAVAVKAIGGQVRAV